MPLYRANLLALPGQLRYHHRANYASVSARADLTNQLQRVGSILHVIGKNTDTAIVGYRWTGMGGHHAMYC